jgi:hypothetical protein
MIAAETMNLTSDRTKIVLTTFDSSRNYELKIEKGIQEERKPLITPNKQTDK